MSINLLHPTPATEICGCYYCMSIFRKEEINIWYDNDNTPECPACGIDSVMTFPTCIGIGEISIELKKVHQIAFRIVEG